MGTPPNHTGCTGRVEELGERKFLLLLSAALLQEGGRVWLAVNRFLGDERCYKSETASTQNLWLSFSPSLDPLWIWLVGSVLLLCQDSESKQQWISHCYCSSPNSKQLSEEWGSVWKTEPSPPLPRLWLEQQQLQCYCKPLVLDASSGTASVVIFSLLTLYCWGTAQTMLPFSG